MGHQLLHHVQLRVFRERDLRLSHSGIHAADLGRIQVEHRVLLQIDLRHGVQDLFSRPFPFSVILFRIGDGRPLSHVESMDAVVPCRVAARVVDAAAGHDGHVRAALDIEIIVYDVGHAGSVHHHRDVHLFPLGLFADIDVDPLFVRFPADLDVLRISVAEGLSVVAQVVGALLLKAVIVYFFQDLICYRIQLHRPLLLPACPPGRRSPRFPDPGSCSPVPPETASAGSRPCLRSSPLCRPAPP